MSVLLEGVEMENSRLNNKFWIASIILILFNFFHMPISEAFIFGPKNYDECIQKNLKSGMSDLQTRAIVQTCRRQFPQQETQRARRRFSCDNGITYSQPVPTQYSDNRGMSYARVERMRDNEVFNGYSLSYSRISEKIDTVNTEWSDRDIRGDIRYKVTISNKLNFGIRSIFIGYSEEAGLCSEKSIIMGCSGGVGAGLTGTFSCPSPPIDGSFRYCIVGIGYSPFDDHRAIAEVAGTQCDVVD